MAVSDKESMLNDIPALCSLVKVELLNTIIMNNLFIFFIKNKHWGNK
jgi:hypothetical protein